MEENVALDSSKQKKFVKSLKGLKKLMKKSGAIPDKSEKKEIKPIKDGKVTKKRFKARGLVYLSHIPHGFYEHQMTQYFKQFGVVTNARVIRSKHTGRSKGHAFVEFKDTAVAQIVAETMNNYLMGKRLIKGSQLRAPAEVTFHMSSDEEDDVPLSSLSKRRRTMDLTLKDSDTVPSCTSDVSTNSTFVQPTVPRNQTYRWKNRHIPNHFNQWNDEQGPKNLQSPLYYFDCLFNNNVIELLVRYTNLYAGQRNKVGKVTVSEMKCFLGILMYSGYVVVPRRFMYWEKSTDADFRIVHNAMSRDRFTFIMSNLHCCDNTVLGDSPDKFAKLRPLFDELNKIFTEMAPLEENYSIVIQHSCHSCKQFIRGKPIRWGYKLWVGATRSGYVIWFDPYQGKSSTIAEGYKQFGLGGNVILEFADVLQGRDPTLPFHLFFDNYFFSIPLLHELSNRGLRATGTIRENRTSKCPLESNKDFKNTDRGSFVFKSSLPTNILVCKWNDNSVVTVASNTETVEPLQKVKRFSQELKRFVHIDQPSVIRKYNENMGGVDRSDQNIGLYRTSIHGKKWYFSLFCHTLDMAVHNAWQLYKRDGGEHDHLTFRRLLAKGLLESYKKSDKRGPCPTSRSHLESSRYDGVDHLVQYSAPQLRCKVCKVKNFFICQKCKIHLHPKNCFLEYHTKTQ